MKDSIRNRVEKRTIGQIRSFLDELANGSTNYRSLHSLTEQIEHQYHGRFVIELLQNAHDALSLGVGQGKRRISLVFDRAEGEFGTLYAAN